MKEKKNNFITNLLIIAGVVVLCTTLIYLMKYFFIDKSYIKINMSTDKKLEYITINNKEELISTQKYVSDLNYTMRYDIDNFKVLKYRGQDIYKYKNAPRILVIVERTVLPENCMNTSNSYYDSCIVEVDDYTEEYYISDNNKTYKITVKTPNLNDFEQNINARIDYMLKSFSIVKD